MPREVTITVPEGLGDIFWVHQLILPNVEFVRYEILNTGASEDPRRARADGFLRLLPKVAGVHHRVVSSREYDRLVKSRHSLRDVLAHGKGEFSCNAALELGVRLEQLSEGLPIAETIAITGEACELPRDFVALYVSGTTMLPNAREQLRLWNVARWAEFVRGFYAKYHLDMPLVILGAEYDRSAMHAVQIAITKLIDVPIELQWRLRPAQVCYLLQQARVFLGYQSGLSVLADQFDRRQVMVYFPYLDSMRNSWPKHASIESGRYQSFTFDQSPELVLEALPWTSI